MADPILSRSRKLTSAFRRGLRRRALAAAVCGLVASALPASAVRLAGRVFDVQAEIEVRDLPAAAAESAVTAAFQEVDRSAAALRALESAAAAGPVALDPALRSITERALGFCYWSENVVGPLGGELFRLLGLRAPVAALPNPETLSAALGTARCERATVDPASSRLDVVAGSRLDFFPFELGWAVDRAAEILTARGATNFEIVVGPVRRGVGPGPAGLGWKVQPAAPRGLEEPLSPFYLRDRAFALLSPADRPLSIAGDPVVPYVDQRTGRTAGGIAQVMVVAELGADANALAYAMFALGPRDGMMRVGGLTPRPSIRWLLGSGESPPVITDHNWAAVPRH